MGARSRRPAGFGESLTLGALLAVLCVSLSAKLVAQAPEPSPPPVDGDQLGAWYMYFWNTRFGESPWGLQGDVQLRQWNVAGDLEQLLLRGGLTYTPANVDGTFTLGYASITTGQFGGDFDGTVHENRVYQEALLPHRIADRILLTHRFRYEQRFNEGQDFRTRYRYMLFFNVPFNDTKLGKDVWHLALYNELFVNGQRDIGDGRSVEWFDRNRTYGGIGYGIAEGLRVQLGVMRQTTNAWAKNQLQVSLHQAW